MVELAKTPWVATGWKSVVVNDAGGNTLCVCPQGRNRDSLENIQANARLIAAAPDLLAALEGLMFMIDFEYPMGKAAIAKAKGQTEGDKIEGDK